MHRCGAHGSGRLMWPPARGPSMASNKKIEGVWSKGEDPGGDPDRHRVIRAARQWPGQSTATQTPQGREIGRVDPKGGGTSNLQSPYHETNRRKGDGPLDCGCGWPPSFFFLFFLAGRTAAGMRGPRRIWARPAAAPVARARAGFSSLAGRAAARQMSAAPARAHGAAGRSWPPAPPGLLPHRGGSLLAAGGGRASACRKAAQV